MTSLNATFFEELFDLVQYKDNIDNNMKKNFGKFMEELIATSLKKDDKLTIDMDKEENILIAKALYPV